MRRIIPTVHDSSFLSEMDTLDIFCQGTLCWWLELMYFNICCVVDYLLLPLTLTLTWLSWSIQMLLAAKASSLFCAWTTRETTIGIQYEKHAQKSGYELKWHAQNIKHAQNQVMSLKHAQHAQKSDMHKSGFSKKTSSPDEPWRPIRFLPCSPVDSNDIF